MTIQTRISNKIDRATGKFALFVIGLASVVAATPESADTAVTDHQRHQSGARSVINGRA